MKWDIRRLLAPIALCLMTGCVVVEPIVEDPEVTHRLDSLLVDVDVGDPATELLQLSDELKQQLEQRVNPKWGDARKFIQLGEFFFGDEERNIQYDAALTRTAEETFVAGRGNCLSMSSLFVASARHLRFDAGFEAVQVKPNWTHEGETMIRYEHIVASGDLGNSSYVVDFLPQFVGERGRRTRVTDEQALALYYSNLAAEAIINENPDEGISRSLQALKLWPGNSNTWSNLGAAYRRKGIGDLAEASYRRALALNRENYSALSNLTQFYRMEGREKEADEYLQTVRRYYHKNPYYHFQVAQMQVTAGKYEQARASLELATRLKRNDPALHEALADIYGRLDDPNASAKQTAYAEQIRRRNNRLDHEEQQIFNSSQLKW